VVAASSVATAWAASPIEAILTQEGAEDVGALPPPAGCAATPRGENNADNISDVIIRFILAFGCAYWLGVLTELLIMSRFYKKVNILQTLYDK
jgi:hypothetical protein